MSEQRKNKLDLNFAGKVYEVKQRDRGPMTVTILVSGGKDRNTDKWRHSTFLRVAVWGNQTGCEVAHTLVKDDLVEGTAWGRTEEWEDRDGNKRTELRWTALAIRKLGDLPTQATPQYDSEIPF